jgi:integrase
MPRRAELKVVSRPGTKTLYVRGTVRGIHVFESAGTSNPALAEEYRAKLESDLYREAVHGPAPAKAVENTLGEAVLSYLECEQRSKNTKDYVRKLLIHFGDCPLSAITQPAVDGACKAILRANATGATKLRQVIAPLRAILRHAASRQLLTVLPIIATPKIVEPDKEALRPAQVIALIRSASPHLRPLLTFAAGTGARPAEYLDLTWPDVDLFGKQVVLRTKGGGTRRFTMPPVVITALESLSHREGPVFRTGDGDRYVDTKRQSGGQFGTGWAGACQRAGLPGDVRVYPRSDRNQGPSYERFAPRHTPYVLRHSWASWHYRIHKDLKLLQADGGWKSQDMLDTYVHLLPEAYSGEALAFLNGEVDLHFNEPAVDRRFRAIAVQSGRTTRLGRPKRSVSI